MRSARQAEASSLERVRYANLLSEDMVIPSPPASRMSTLWVPSKSTWSIHSGAGGVADAGMKSDMILLVPPFQRGAPVCSDDRADLLSRRETGRGGPTGAPAKTRRSFTFSGEKETNRHRRARCFSKASTVAAVGVFFVSGSSFQFVNVVRPNSTALSSPSINCVIPSVR